MEDFESAAKEKRRGVLGEWAAFLGATKKYWLVPMILILMLLMALVILSQTSAAPFIYTLF